MQKKNIPVDFPKPKHDWIEVQTLKGFEYQPQFVASETNPERFSIRWYRNSSAQQGQGWVRFGPLCEGPPKAAHGGAVAAVLDEAMGSTCWMFDHPAVAAHIEVDFRLPAKLNQWHECVTQITKVEGRKVYVSTKLLLDDRTVAEGTGIFIKLHEESLKNLKAYQAKQKSASSIL